MYKRQVRKVELNADGTVKSDVITPVNPTAAVSVTADNGYEFVNWTSGDETYADEAAIKGAKFSEDKVFTANFTKRTDLSYGVHYFYENVEDPDEADVKTDATFGMTIPYDMKTPKDHGGHHYVLEKVVKTGDGTVTTTEANNIVNVYYVLDEKGENGGSDGTADEYQATFTYVSGGNGTVSGTTSEMHTVRKVELNADGTVKSDVTTPVLSLIHISSSISTISTVSCI